MIILVSTLNRKSWIVVMLSTCYPVRCAMRSTLGQQEQNLGLGLTIMRPVLERIQGFLLRAETRMILYIGIFLTQDTMVFRMSVYRLLTECPGKNQLSGLKKVSGPMGWTVFSLGAWISDFFSSQNRRIGLESGKSAREFIFLCSACKFFKISWWP